jgi:hypothetical protein
MRRRSHPCLRYNGIAAERSGLLIGLAALVLPLSMVADVRPPGGWYRAALSAMQSIREPAFLTYRTTVPAGSTTIAISRSDGGVAQMSVLDGVSNAQSWDVSYRDSDGTAAVTLPDGSRAISHLAIFDPTWRGAFTWLRRGIWADLMPAVRTAPATASPSPAASPAAELPVIAMVGAINETAYSVTDAGAASCADGRYGYRLRAKPRYDPGQHPLVEAVVDVSTFRFCSMRFREHLPGPTVSLDLDIELHFGQVGPYYLITDGVVSGAIRPFKRPGWFPMNTTFRYDRFEFPATLPDALFVPPPA